MRSRTQSLVLCGLSIALLAAGAAIVFPLGPIPFTLQTLVIMLIVLVLTPKEAVVAVGGYLLLGAIGLPVFAGFSGGFGILLGPTGGFLVGFFVGALLAALLRNSLKHRLTGKRSSMALDIFSILVVILIYDLLGMLWFMHITGSTLAASLAISVLPFIVPDVIKAVAAFACAQPIRAALGRGVSVALKKGTGDKK